MHDAISSLISIHSARMASGTVGTLPKSEGGSPSRSRSAASGALDSRIDRPISSRLASDSASCSRRSSNHSVPKRTGTAARVRLRRRNSARTALRRTAWNTAQGGAVSRVDLLLVRGPKEPFGRSTKISRQEATSTGRPARARFESRSESLAFVWLASIGFNPGTSRRDEKRFRRLVAWPVRKCGKARHGCRSRRKSPSAAALCPNTPCHRNLGPRTHRVDRKTARVNPPLRVEKVVVPLLHANLRFPDGRLPGEALRLGPEMGRLRPPKEGSREPLSPVPGIFGSCRSSAITSFATESQSQT